MEETKNLSAKEFIALISNLVMQDAVGEYEFAVTEGKNHPPLLVTIINDDEERDLGSVGKFNITINSAVLGDYGLTSKEAVIGLLANWSQWSDNDNIAAFGMQCLDYYWMTHKDEYNEDCGDSDYVCQFYDSLDDETKEQVQYAIDHMLECSFEEVSRKVES